MKNILNEINSILNEIEEQSAICQITGEEKKEEERNRKLSKQLENN